MVIRKTQKTGRFVVKNDGLLRRKAESSDPRAPFYKAMLSENTFEGYYRASGDIAVHVPTRQQPKVTPHMEIVYALYSGWIQAI